MANWPNRLDFKLPAKAISDIDLFVSNAAHLSKIVEVSSGLAPKFRFEDILEPISKEVGISSNDLRIIFNSLENLKDLEEDLGSSETAIARMSQALDAPLKEKVASAASDIKIALGKYGRDNPVTITIKAQRLAYTRDQLLNDSEIITDARPIFDNSGSKLVEFVITHTLVVTAFRNGRVERHFMSMDNADLLTLRKACERAMIKARTLKESLSKTAATEIIRDETAS